MRRVFGVHAGNGKDLAPSQMPGGSVQLEFLGWYSASYNRQHLLGHPELLET